MGLDTEERQNIVYFTGYEVEHTAAYGLKTLFVVGTPLLEEILKEAESQSVEQIYFGTSQSFTASSYEEWETWSDRIRGCLDAGYWVALDFDVKYAEEIHESSWNEYDKFIPMISVKLPFIKLFNYNATVKIDDRTWGFSNPGVWTHPLNELMTRKSFTDWTQYKKDEAIDGR